jgi:hypothetical protein
MRRRICVLMAGLLWCGSMALVTLRAEPQSSMRLVPRFLEGEQLFEHETFGGNGRTAVESDEPVSPGCAAWNTFQTVLVSEFNAAGNPAMDLVFRNQEHDFDPATNRDGTPDDMIEVSSPDPGRALISGRATT